MMYNEKKTCFQRSYHCTVPVMEKKNHVSKDDIISTIRLSSNQHEDPYQHLEKDHKEDLYQHL